MKVGPSQLKPSVGRTDRRKGIVLEREAYHDQLMQATSSGVRTSLAALRAAHGREQLWAYALVSDDDLDGVGCLACTEEFLAAEAAGYAKLLGDGWEHGRALELLRFMPVDWTYDDGVHALDPASALLRAHCAVSEGSAAFAAHVRLSFEALVEGLLKAREAEELTKDVFLTVLSSDPHLLELEDEGVRRLNSADTYRRWKAQMR